MPHLSGCEVSEIPPRDSPGCHQRQMSIAGSGQEWKTRWGRALLVDSSEVGHVMETSTQDVVLCWNSLGIG